MSQISRAASIAALSLAVIACDPQIDSRGHAAAMEDVTITPQTSTKAEVQAAYGSPSSVSNFGNETWYYISAQKERVAFLKPKIIDQDVIAVEFDAAGTVSKVDHYALKDGKKVALVERSTPTEGHSLGLMEQLLGNLGRFNNAKRDPLKTNPGSRPY